MWFLTVVLLLVVNESLSMVTRTLPAKKSSSPKKNNIDRNFDSYPPIPPNVQQNDFKDYSQPPNSYPHVSNDYGYPPQAHQSYPSQPDYPPPPPHDYLKARPQPYPDYDNRQHYPAQTQPHSGPPPNSRQSSPPSPPPPVPVYVNNYGKDDHSSPNHFSSQYQPFYQDHEHQHDNEDEYSSVNPDHEINIAADKDDQYLGPEEEIAGDIDGFVEVGFHGEHVLDGEEGFGLEHESDTGEYGMYFDQKYEQRLAAQRQFEKEVEIVLDNRVTHPEEEIYIENSEYEESEGQDGLDERQLHQLEYDHGANDKLELLSNGGHDDDDLFTFNAHEIYITEPEYDDHGSNYEDHNSNFDERSESVGNPHDGFGVDDLFNPKRADRDSSYDKDFYQFYEPNPPQGEAGHDHYSPPGAYGGRGSQPRHGPHHHRPGPRHRADHHQPSHFSNDGFPDIFGYYQPTTRPPFRPGF